MLPYLFVIIAVLVRLVPPTLSFTPVGAALLFFGASASRRRMWIPLALLAGSDLYLTLGYYNYPFSWDHFVTWGWYAAIMLLGGTLRSNIRPLPVLGASLATAVSFFLLSNFAVWAAWDMYPHSFAGLTAAYVVGLPYFRRELVSDVLFASVFFSVPLILATIRENVAGRRAAA